MLKNKTIQMDAPLIDSIEKKMAADRNFSFQAVTRDYIEIGMEAEKLIKPLVTLYQMGVYGEWKSDIQEARKVESLLMKLIPEEFAEMKRKAETELAGG